MRWNEIGGKAGGNSDVRSTRLGSEPFKISPETPEERSHRIRRMYGIGRTVAEEDYTDQLANEVTIRLKQAQAEKARADSAKSIASFAAEIEEELPWPNPGSRSLNLLEQEVLRARLSRIAGRILPRS